MTEEGYVREQGTVQQLDPRHVGGRKRDTGPTLRREEEIAQGRRSRVIVVRNDLVSEEHAAEAHRAVVVGRGIEPGPIQRPCHQQEETAGKEGEEDYNPETTERNAVITTKDLDPVATSRNEPFHRRELRL